MYRNAGKWEDSYRIAKSQGGPAWAKNIVFLWAKSLGGDSAVKLLSKFGLLEEAIDYATDNLLVLLFFAINWSLLLHATLTVLKLYVLLMLIQVERVQFKFCMLRDHIDRSNCFVCFD